MRIKRFEAPDTRTALAMIKNEMGEDAIILATRTISSPRSNGAKRKNGSAPLVEVVAAMDYDSGETCFSPAQNQQRLSVSSNYMGYSCGPDRSASPDRQAGIAAGSSAGTAVHHTSEIPADDTRTGRFEVQDLRRRFSSLLNLYAPSRHPVSGKAQEPVSSHPEIPRGQTARPDPEAVARWRNKLIEKLKVIPMTEQIEKQSQTVVALVGATGVGKTTTVAKIAAWFSLRELCRVALISMDCYRIGATDQLRTYAQIMGLPCEIALRKKDLAHAVSRHADKDLIIIDTAGKSPYDRQHVAELETWFNSLDSIKSYLVISATTKKEDLTSVIEAYSPLSVNGLILTKLDETRAYATLCQQVAASSLPVSCICTGQQVPSDFQMASSNFLNTLFSKGWNAAMAS